MPLPTPQIDHVVVNVLGGLDEAAARYKRLGFLLTERGHHTLGSSNHLAIFGDDYLELLGFEPGKAGHRPDLVRYPAGLSGLVLKPPADPDFAAALTAMGVAAEPAQEFSRPVALPDGTERDARFRTVNAPGAVPEGRLFFCHHHTPELVWRDEWRQHANRVTGIAAFTIAAADPANAAAVFERLIGAGTEVEGGLSFAAGKAAIRVLTHEAVTGIYGDAVPAGTDRMVALDLRTASLDAVWAALHDGGVPGREADGVLVRADEACGVALRFVA